MPSFKPIVSHKFVIKLIPTDEETKRNEFERPYLFASGLRRRDTKSQAIKSKLN